MSEKKPTPVCTKRTSHKLSDPAVRRRVFALLHDRTQTDEGRREIGEWFDQLVTDAGVWFDSPEVFRVVFPLATANVERGRASDRVGTRQAYRELQCILAEVDAGKSLGEIAAEREARMNARSEQLRSEPEERPEPKDGLSPEWRYWKIARITRGFESGGDEYREAWREFVALFDGLRAEPSFWHVSNATALLPHLLIARQDIDAGKAFERRCDAAMRGAQTRKAKRAKAAGR